MSTKVFKLLAAESLQYLDFPFRSESGMEAFIMENDSILATDDGISVKFICSQYHLEEGRKSKDTSGRIDLIYEIDEKYLAIIELKNRIVYEDDTTQLKDYLDAFNSKKEKYLSELGIETDMKIIGIIIGTEINQDFKAFLMNGIEHSGMKIIGMTISRFCSEDKKEVYIFTDRYAEKVSSFTKLRFNDLSDFLLFQKKDNNVGTNVLDMLEYLHEKIKKKFTLEDSSLIYAKRALTFNVPKRQRKKVFLYVHISNKKIKVFLDIYGNVPNDFIRNTDKRSSETSYFKEFSDRNEIRKDFFDLLEKSYKALLEI